MRLPKFLGNNNVNIERTSFLNEFVYYYDRFILFGNSFVGIERIDD